MGRKETFDPWMNPEIVPRGRRRGPPGGGASGGGGGRHGLRAGRAWILGAIVGAVGIVAVYSLIGGEHGIVRLVAMEREEQRLRDEVAQADGRLESLRGRLRNIDRTLEEAARTRYGMARPNEEIYEIVPDSAVAGAAAPRAGGSVRDGFEDGDGGFERQDLEQESEPAGSEPRSL